MKKKYSHVLIGLLIGFVILLSAILLIWIPYWRVSQFGINNATENATLENQYRATFAQILGGVAIGISLYYTWQRNNIAQEGQITERFTRAIDQLGNRKMEIRLGGIYALERISNESEKDHYQIMEILTAYVRKNSSVEIEETQDKISLDIQAILTVIGRRKHLIDSLYLYLALDLRETYLKQIELDKANLEWVDFSRTNLKYALFSKSNLQHAEFIKTDLYSASFMYTDLGKAYFTEADLRLVNLKSAKLEGADFYGADLKGARNLTVDQLSKVKTLYNAKLDDELLIPLKEKYPVLFDEPEQ